MNILWLTWKDKSHPEAGGAEVVNEELAKRLIKDNHQVTFLVGNFKNGKSETSRNGYSIVRVGNKFTLYFKAIQYLRKQDLSHFDLVIDEINTLPFYAKYFTKLKNIVFIHQLAREVWFHQIAIPMNIIGYFLEPLMLRALNDRTAITISDSTKKDLLHLGFHKKNIHIISEGIEFTPPELPSLSIKETSPTLLYFGAIRSMKQPIEVIKAFNIAKKHNKDLQLWIAGGGRGKYYKRFLRHLNASPYKNSIQYFGKVSDNRKKELMKKAHVLCVTSIREGWGLVVTEANALGTPAIAYNTHGLRDSIQHKKTGIICEKNTPHNLAKNILSLLENNNEYESLRRKGWEWSKSINFDTSYIDFIKVLKEV